MQGNFDYCAALVREADRDRFLATLFAPAEHRDALYARIDARFDVMLRAGALDEGKREGRGVAEIGCWIEGGGRVHLRGVRREGRDRVGGGVPAVNDANDLAAPLGVALLALIHLARAKGDGFVAVSAIAEAQQINSRFPA